MVRTEKGSQIRGKLDLRRVSGKFDLINEVLRYTYVRFVLKMGLSDP